MSTGSDIYYSPARQGEAIYREKASKFIGLAYPVNTEGEIRDYLATVRKKFYDANHHCYAYCLGATQEVFRFNDDGEPSGSAGRPIYGQIQSKGLSDALVIVVRYFGGTKLGIPGLIKAYRTAASEALENSGKKERTITKTCTVTFGYENMNDVMRIIKAENLELLSQESGNNCKIVFRVRASREEKVLARFRRNVNIYISVDV
jgi:uncharacterized YigZ family protein